MCHRTASRLCDAPGPDTQAKLGGMPMVMHNRQWSPHSDYIKRLPQFKWLTGPEWAVPADPAAFFDWFFQQQVCKPRTSER